MVDDNQSYELDDVDDTEYAIYGEITPETIIQTLTEGEELFSCRGTARVKVGAKVIQLPIRSVDMEEIRRRMKMRRPNPPTERTFIRADSPEGRAAGLNKNKWATVEKEADPGYREALEEYNTKLGYLFILNGLDTTVKKKDGTIVWHPEDESKQNPEEAVSVLRGMGITNWQFSDISEAIQNLTRFEEEEIEKNYDED
jgi:hypothetical protein